jgi:hypothetical protein
MGNKNYDGNIVVVHGVDLSVVYLPTPDIACLDAIHMHPPYQDAVSVALLRLRQYCHLLQVMIMNALREKTEGKKVTRGGAQTRGSGKGGFGIVGEDKGGGRKGREGDPCAIC